MTGGFLFSNSARATTYLDSTETMVSEEDGWKINRKHSLPQPMAYLQVISIQNNIIMIGRIDFMSTAFRKKYSSTCTFAMYITKKSRRLQKILLDFFVIYIAKAINSSDRMNYTFGVKT